MGHKKRLPTSRSKIPPLPPPEDPSAVASPPDLLPLVKIENYVSVPSDDASYSLIKQECERALTALRRGNHNKALRLMKEFCVKYDNNSLVYRVQGTICVKVAAIIDDPNAKQRYLKNAFESARKAVQLCPNSIEFAHFYANLLYEAASDVKEFEEVMRECDRAIDIENPVDPGKESLQDESQLKNSTPEARIAHVVSELRSLKQKASLSSISSWMKNLGNGEEIRLIPIRRVIEDPMEVRLVQTARRPNEIKKATKTLDEKRKEIEVRVAAARLLQQKSENLGGEEEKNGDKGAEVSSSVSDKRGDRRKYGNRKIESNAERKDRVRSYWNSMSLGMKKDLLKIRISDLKNYFGSSSKNGGLACEVLNEVLGFGEQYKTWGFWMCCKCFEKFVDSESHIHHVVQEHVGNLMPKMQAVLPQNVDYEWTEMILNGFWKPLDVSSAVKMLGIEECQTAELDDSVYSGSPDDECDDCFKDAWDASPEKENSRDGYNVRTDKVSSIECKECNGNNSLMAFYNKWPLSDDAERANLLEKMRSVFEILIKHKYLAASHLNKVIHLAVQELRTFAYGSQLLSYGVDRTPLCIYFLDASQLRKILKFLQELSHCCGLGRYPEKTGTIDDASARQSSQIKVEIVLNGDASCLYLDECLLPSECGTTSLSDDVATTTPTHVEFGNGVPPDADALLSWMFAGPSSGELLQSWIRTKDEKVHQGMEILQIIEKEFCNLQNLSQRKCEHLSYDEALQSVEDLLLEEGKRRETDTLDRGFYEYVLRKRKDELARIGNDALFAGCGIEFDVIGNILKEVEEMNHNQFGYQDTYVGMNSQLCDLESGEDNDWRMKDYADQMDTCIQGVIDGQKNQLSVELSKIDARIMRIVSVMHQLELKLEPVSSHDYRLILLPLVKSYMRAHLEDLAEKDATEKSDAVREALLAELARDSKKGTRGGDHLRNTQEKAKDKKKNRDHRKTKDSKAAPGNGLHGDTSDSSPVALDDDQPDSKTSCSVNVDDLKLQEEEYRRKIEFEEEERKLEKTLEYQRRIENEAKLKHLAEQQLKKSNQTLPGTVAGGLQYVYPDSCTNAADEPLEQWAHKDGIPNNIGAKPKCNGDLLPTKPSSASGSPIISSLHDTHVNRESSNGGSTGDGVLPSERRMGRRGRRQRSSTKSFDGKYQPIAAEKNIDEVAGCTPNMGDSGTKTLRQLHAEEDDEERFQADLKKAVRQSLDSFQARQKTPSGLRVPQSMPLEDDSFGEIPNKVAIEDASRSDVVGMGLQNDVGEYNCFLNVIIQSLWHLRRFREEFLRVSLSVHLHVGEPCVVCALHEIFTALSQGSSEMRGTAIAPTSLRMALSNLYPDSNFFQEAQMNDASEVLGVLFDCLHHALTPSSSISDSESAESNSMGLWDCSNNGCLVHSIFGMHIFEQMNCYNCGLESRRLKYTSFFHNINASALRTMKVMCPENSFDELLNLVEMNHQLACDPENEGCGKLNHIHHFLSTPPHVFTTVLGWQNTCESADDIASTLEALNTEIDISILYRGLDPKCAHRLVSVVCYYGQHYHCFAYSQDKGQWIMYDDKTVKAIGSWAEVLSMCKRGHLQPQVLFFEAVN